ncbi:MAG: FG-GAP repeat protein [Caldilineaceae bacterium]|nr:FG-GAP repeat protein [Caldilineaceae bacterium]
MTTNFTHRSYPSWRDIDQAKPLFLETTFIDGGVATAVIITPERPAYQAQARKLQQAVFARTGVQLPLLRDSDCAPWQPAATHQILLGNLMDNAVVAPLYHRNYIAADAHYPGGGGHVLRTVHDPWGTGCNVILAGGSDIAGVTTSVARLLASLQQDETHLWVPALLDVQLSPEFLARFPELVNEPDAAFQAAEMAKAHEMLETGAHGGITDPLGRAGFYYYITGKVGWAELFKSLAFLMYEDFQKGREQYGGAWGMDADFRLSTIMPAWDLVEEAPVFTDEERLQITRIYAQFIEDAVPHAADAVQHRRTRHNHWTYAALGLLCSAQYFARYYGVREANEWLYVADECFVPQCHTARSHENSNGYQWLTLSHALKYALMRPYPAFFEEGHVRTICDLAIDSLDNLGFQSSYGDTHNIEGWGTEFPILAAAAWYYGEGRYAWLLQRSTYDTGFRIGVRTLGTHRNDVEAVEPVEMIGARLVPLDPTFHNSFEGDKILPAAAAYDKVVFRRDFDPESEYLLLDGLAVGGHKHYDCNALIRLTALGRIWLTDGDYYCSAPNFHSGVLPLRNGETSAMPPFTWCDFVVDLPNSGFSRTTVKGYGGTDWERNIMWRKGRYFLVADVMRAQAEGDYDFRALWQVIGETTLDGQQLTIRQQDRQLDLINLDGATLSTAIDRYNTAHWDTYAHADPTLTILRQNRSCSLEKGEVAIMLNILHPHAEITPSLATRHIGQGSVLVDEPEGLTWLGVRTAAPLTSPCHTDAAILTVTPYACSLVRATYFGCAAEANAPTEPDLFFCAEHPIDIAFDWARGQGTVTATLPTLLTFYGLDAAAVTVDGEERAVRHQAETVTFSVPPGRHTLAFLAYQAPPSASNVSTALAAAWHASTTATTAKAANAASATIQSPSTWQLTDGTFTTVAAVGDGHVVAGTTDGVVRLIKMDGAIVWQQQVNGAVTAVTSAQFGETGTVIAVGTNEATVTLFTLAGATLWRYAVPFYKRLGIVRTLVAADINGDGVDEIIVGAENWHHYVLDQQGNKRWHFESVHASTATAVADIDNDGQPELLAATEYNWWFAVSNQGQKLWQHNTIGGMGVTHVATARQLDGSALVAFGCRDGTVQVVDAAGKLRFVLRTADTITGLAAADINGDGAEELLVASVMQNTYAVNGSGEILWRYGNATPPTHLQVTTAAADFTIWVAEQSGALLALDATGQATPVLAMGEAATEFVLLPATAPQLCVAALPTRGLVAWRL